MTQNLKTLAGVFQEPLTQSTKSENDPPQKLGGEVWYQ